MDNIELTPYIGTTYIYCSIPTDSWRPILYRPSEYNNNNVSKLKGMYCVRCQKADIPTYSAIATSLVEDHLASLVFVHNIERVGLFFMGGIVPWHFRYYYVVDVLESVIRIGKYI